MPTICPNCLRPVRTDAKFCGFCGTNLNPTAHDDTAPALPSPQKIKETNENSANQTVPKRSNAKRAVLIILIILLILVLLVAFLVRYWPVFSLSIGLTLPSETALGLPVVLHGYVG